MASDLDWGQAACRQPGVDPDMWFDWPDIQPPGTGHAPSAAARVCMSRCPEVLRDACLRQAMAEEGDAARDGRHGVYGGANPRERYELWKRLNPEKAAEQEERSQRIAASRARAQAGRAGPAAA
jgi:hypothetical protein